MPCTRCTGSWGYTEAKSSGSSSRSRHGVSDNTVKAALSNCEGALVLRQTLQGRVNEEMLELNLNQRFLKCPFYWHSDCLVSLDGPLLMSPQMLELVLMAAMLPKCPSTFHLGCLDSVPAVLQPYICIVLLISKAFRSYNSLLGIGNKSQVVGFLFLFSPLF